LYQLGKPQELPELPDLEALHAWPCPHPHPVPPPPGAPHCPAAIPNAVAPGPAELTAPTVPPAGQRADHPAQPPPSHLLITDPEAEPVDPRSGAKVAGKVQTFGGTLAR